MATYIDGIASSMAIDTAGEIVDLKGLDCSSLIGSAFNWEHKSDIPAQLVGKILNYKKIFSQDDCETDRHLLFWNKIKIPFLYVMGRLFDDKQESAKQLAALFIDDSEHPNEQPMVGFSIEGAKLDKQGMVITKSIARKVTCTNIPANKSCVAEMVPSKESSSKDDDLDDIFKTEPFTEIQLFKSEIKIPMKKQDLIGGTGPSSPAGILENSEIKKAQVPGSKYPPAASVSAAPKTTSGTPKFESIGATGKPAGQKIGATSTGVDIHSHKPVGDYGQLSSKEHGEMAAKHKELSQTSGTAAERSHHNDKSKLHSQAAQTSSKRENRFNTAMSGKRQAAINTARKMNPINKAMTAGSGMAAPSALEGGAALVSESLEGSNKEKQGKSKSIGSSNIPKSRNASSMGKSEDKWLNRAEEEYDKWDKKEEFRKFMSEKLPKLARGEIDAIGKVLALGKSLKMEKAISRLNPAYDEDSKMHSSISKKEKQKSSIASSIPSSIPSPVLSLSEKMGKFDDGVLDPGMSMKEKQKSSLKKGK